jgi:transposase-like protein
VRMAQKRRRVYPPELKFKIVKEDLKSNVRVSELCRHYEIYPVDYYRWKREVEAAIMNDFKKPRKKERKLTAREQQLLEENERLQRAIVQ